MQNQYYLLGQCLGLEIQLSQIIKIRKGVLKLHVSLPFQDILNF